MTPEPFPRREDYEQVVPGLYRNGIRVVVIVPEILAHSGLADTPANRALLVTTFERLGRAINPQARTFMSPGLLDDPEDRRP